MSLPFTVSEFLDVFARYNNAVWPLQWVMAGVALLAAVAAIRGRGGRLVSSYLAIQWAWTGVAYHWIFFARINPAARVFAAIWLAGGVAFAWAGAVKGKLSFRTPARYRQLAGIALIAYALFLYPLLGHLDGRVYPFAPTYGAPCPVTILTIGLLWLARPPFPRVLLIAPLLWAAIGSIAAFALDVREDLGLLVAGLSAVALLYRGPRRTSAAPRANTAS